MSDIKNITILKVVNSGYDSKTTQNRLSPQEIPGRSSTGNRSKKLSALA